MALLQRVTKTRCIFLDEVTAAVTRLKLCGLSGISIEFSTMRARRLFYGESNRSVRRLFRARKTSCIDTFVIRGEVVVACFFELDVYLEHIDLTLLRKIIRLFRIMLLPER